MTQIAHQKQFECDQRATAEQALRGLSDKDRVHFALKIMMETNDPDAVAALRWAQGRIVEHADVLVREAFDRERA